MDHFLKFLFFCLIIGSVLATHPHSHSSGWRNVTSTNIEGYSETEFAFCTFLPSLPVDYNNYNAYVEYYFEEPVTSIAVFYPYPDSEKELTETQKVQHYQLLRSEEGSYVVAYQLFSKQDGMMSGWYSHYFEEFAFFNGIVRSSAPLKAVKFAVHSENFRSVDDDSLSENCPFPNADILHFPSLGFITASAWEEQAIAAGSQSQPEVWTTDKGCFSGTLFSIASLILLGIVFSFSCGFFIVHSLTKSWDITKKPSDDYELVAPEDSEDGVVTLDGEELVTPGGFEDQGFITPGSEQTEISTPGEQPLPLPVFVVVQPMGDTPQPI